MIPCCPFFTDPETQQLRQQLDREVAHWRSHCLRDTLCRDQKMSHHAHIYFVHHRLWFYPTSFLCVMFSQKWSRSTDEHRRYLTDSALEVRQSIKRSKSVHRPRECMCRYLNLTTGSGNALLPAYNITSHNYKLVSMIHT